MSVGPQSTEITELSRLPSCHSPGQIQQYTERHNKINSITKRTKLEELGPLRLRDKEIQLSD